MILEIMTVEGLYAISLVLSANEKWKAAGTGLNSGSDAMGLLILLAFVSLTILLFWLYSKYKRSEQQLNTKITDLTVTNDELQREVDESNKANKKLLQKVTELMAANEKLQQENAQITHSA
jgi:hypothetical protein